MSKKPLVALCCDQQSDGRRRYAAIDKSGRVALYVTVADCGYGAKLAHDRISQDYTISNAEWAYRVCVAHRRRLESPASFE